VSWDADGTVELSPAAEALRVAVAETAKWQRMACTLAIAVQPVIDGYADNIDWHRAEQALGAMQNEVARWIRTTSQQTEQQKEQPQGD
jgi:hypothetical protein